VGEVRLYRKLFQRCNTKSVDWENMAQVPASKGNRELSERILNFKHDPEFRSLLYYCCIFSDFPDERAGNLDRTLRSASKNCSSYVYAEELRARLLQHIRNNNSVHPRSWAKNGDDRNIDLRLAEQVATYAARSGNWEYAEHLRSTHVDINICRVSDCAARAGYLGYANFLRDLSTSDE